MIYPTLKFVFDRKGHATNNKKEGKVELRISYMRSSVYMLTGVSVLPKQWEDGSVVKREDAEELNDQLQNIRRKVRKVIDEMVDKDELNISEIPTILRTQARAQCAKTTFLEYAQKRAEDKCRGLKNGTTRHYKSCIRFLKQWRGFVFFSDVTERKLWSMHRELQGRGLKNTSIWQNYHKIVKSFINDAIEDGLMKVNPYRRANLPHEDDSTELRHLTPQEFHKLETCQMPTERLERVRDLFVFQTYTCLSYVDMEAFDAKKIREQMYKGKRVKTGVGYEFMLLKPAMAILKKYDYRLPLLSNQKYNDYLKLVAQAANIEKPITSHWARHTGATMLLNEGGVRIEVVARVLGHSTTRETEKVYAKVLDTTIANAMEAFGRKLK